MRARIKNSNIDVEIEGDDENDILEQFAHDYPQYANQAIMVTWRR